MKRHLAISLICVLLVTCSLIIRSQTPDKIHFNQIAEEDGLSNGFVTSIFQDSLGFIWLGTANGLNRYDGYQFKTWLMKKNSSKGLSNQVIWSICGGRNGAIWMATDLGLNRLHPQSGLITPFFHDPNNKNSLSSNQLETVYKDKRDVLWVGTKKGWNRLRSDDSTFVKYFTTNDSLHREARGICEDRFGRLWMSVADVLYLYNREKDSFLAFPLPSKRDTAKKVELIRLLYPDKSGDIWAGTELSGLYRFDVVSKKYIAHFTKNSSKKLGLSHNRISALMEDDSGILWIGTSGGGLNFLSKDKTTIHRFHPDIFEASQENMETIRGMLKDKNGNLWLGTQYGGAKIVLKNKKPFRNYSLTPGKPSSLGGKAVYAQFERPDGKIWIALGEKGFDLLDPKTQTFQHFHLPPEISKKSGQVNLISILEDHNGNLWLCSNDSDIWTKDAKSGNWSTIKTAPSIPDKVWKRIIFCDSNNNIWIGTMNGLFLLDKKKHSLKVQHLSQEWKTLNYDDNNYIESIYEAQDGTIFLATHGGLNYKTAGEDQFHYTPHHSPLFSIHEDKNHKIWVGTGEGLSLYQPKNDTIIEFFESGDRVIQSIVEDKNGCLWMGSRNLVYALNPDTRRIRSFDAQDGVLNRQFFPTGLSQEGIIYLGGTKGIDYFNPSEIKDNDNIPTIVLTGFQLFNKEVLPASLLPDTLKHLSPLSKDITYTDDIILSHRQNDITLEFAALEYTSPNRNRYRYRLIGYDTAWVRVDATIRKAHFTNLSPGKYTFEVQGANNDGLWNKESTKLGIIIQYPWWRKWWAWTGYFFLFAAILLLLRRYELNRQLSKSEAKRLFELDTFKTRLYANITHEFRTPLTIILGMTEQMSNQVSESGKAGLKMIYRNGRQLLSLVNQMLDLSKLQSGQLHLNSIQGDIINYLSYLCEAFHSLAADKNVRIHFQSDMEALLMDYDPGSIQQLISNLLSNAVKFTPSGGDIYINVQKRTSTKEITIRIKDTGIGIPEEYLPHIFNRFYQVDDSSTRHEGGTGLGLSLCYELTQLMQGEIHVKSQVGKGTEFTITLPITQVCPIEKGMNTTIEQPIINPAPQEIFSPTASSSLPHILIVEDNHDVIKYLILCLNNKYNIEIAYNGQQGIEKAVEQIPDLIISDVMMPQKDGFQLCQTLKNDERSSHIPIIMLTAKADIQSKLHGLQMGADAYLPKPFNERELNIRIDNLLKLRQNLQSHYLSLVGIQKGSLSTRPGALSFKEQTEKAFVEKVHQIIISHLDDYQFKVEQLCKEVCLSRTQLHRKLKALTGYSTTAFITFIRLEKAKIMLHDPELTITTIAYDVGFSDPNYFAKVFRKNLGITPSEYRNNTTVTNRDQHPNPPKHHP